MGALDIGIDLGTTKIIIYKEPEGEILREPAVVAINTTDDTVIAVGQEALRMLGRTPGHIRAEFPLNDGVISDHMLTEVMIKEFLKRACNNFLVKHRVIICVPSAITDVEKRALVEVVINSGGRKVYLIEEPIAAAIGAGIDISKPKGTLIVDIGGGTTDVAVISLSGIVASKSFKYAGNKIDEDIIKYFTMKYKLAIGKKMACQVKQDIGNVFNPSEDIKTEVRGRNLLTVYPQKIEVSQRDIYECLIPFGEAIVESIRFVLEKTPPELVSDIYEYGITLTGGGALLGGLAELIEQKIHVKTRIADNPIECVSIGTGKAFNFIDVLQTGFSTETNTRF
ncbi:rod shape-determining protein [Paludicola sp. MB14-C6]|uniref:rod shape-determining protein n=1 Tax=Paludihabitans sp. MB14-C6 TaxID=3070656 RepID=UPI0027DE90A4|nr:rod shape-determining protein [Paludicola sp. MB14-C6]WMJ23241.1 rod shape-determining protein [Paludicola sp. MB14-C6]